MSVNELHPVYDIRVSTETDPIAGIGSSGDTVVNAGTAGSLNAKALRLTTDIGTMLLGTVYHGEVTGCSSTYSSGTCQVTLNAACKHLIIMIGNDDDIAYCVMDSTDPADDLNQVISRYKFKGSTNYTRTSLSLQTAVSTLDFMKMTADSDTLNIYIDGWT